MLHFHAKEMKHHYYSAYYTVLVTVMDQDMLLVVVCKYTVVSCSFK